MRHYCTYFDSNYLPLGLALYESLLEHSSQNFKLYVLCFDECAYSLLLESDLPNLIPVRLKELEKFDPELEEIKASRKPVEYIFSCTAAWCCYLLEVHRNIDIITYLDSDLYFYSDPELVFDELARRSVGIIEHRFPSVLAQQFLQYGRFNVGWVSFRSDAPGLEVLRWWRERCIEWCFDYVEGEKFGDQKYLNRFPELFSNVAVLECKGANLARWNLGSYELDVVGQKVLIDEQPLVFYHFEGIRQLTGSLFNIGLSGYNVRRNSIITESIYRPYISHLLVIKRRLSPGSSENIIPRRRTDIETGSFSKLKSLALKYYSVYLSVVKGDCLRVASVS
jgi:hypothetical protein